MRFDGRAVIEKYIPVSPCERSMGLGERRRRERYDQLRCWGSNRAVDRVFARRKGRRFPMSEPLFKIALSFAFAGVSLAVIGVLLLFIDIVISAWRTF